VVELKASGLSNACSDTAGASVVRILLGHGRDLWLFWQCFYSQSSAASEHRI